MRRATAWVLACAVASLGSPAGAPASESARALFDRGLSAYERGEYEDAVKSFGEAAAQGVEDPIVHYNLGNAHFKAGRLGPAIWHWRKAHALAPRDEDIAANLEYGRFLALDRVEGEDAPADRRVERWLDRFTADEAALVASILWAVAGAAAVAWQLAPVGRAFWKSTAAALCALWAVSFSGAWLAERRDAGAREAVVLAQEAEVRNEPAASSTTAFVLHEGAEVIVEGQRGPWTEISLTGDLRGWVQSDRIAEL
jgi:tetratricopeptide (TPR) repeat protein